MRTYIYMLQSEWLKRKRSAASWLTIIGALFIPVVVLSNGLLEHELLLKLYNSGHVWHKVFMKCWQFMAIFLLPMGVILATSLATQMEFRNNGWKQLHAAPVTLTTIFLSKLSVILFMLIQFFMLFNIGIYLTTVIPSLLYADIPYPKEQFPVTFFLEWNWRFFIDCLPIVGLQYLLSLHFKNFLVPIGAGMGMFVAAMMAINWKFGYMMPYTYSTLEFVKKPGAGEVKPYVIWAVSYFVLFITAAYWLYIRKKEKG